MSPEPETMSILSQEEVPKTFYVGEAFQPARAEPILWGVRPRIAQKRRQRGADFALSLAGS